MRNTVKFDRTVRIMNPVWHQAEVNSNSKYQLKYKRAMVVLELSPGIEYKCAELQALIDRGALIPDEEYSYICSHGFIPRTNGVIIPVSEITTGLDPEEELN